MSFSIGYDQDGLEAEVVPSTKIENAAEVRGTLPNIGRIDVYPG
jgi:hypothetical protein